MFVRWVVPRGEQLLSAHYAPGTVLWALQI